MRNQIIFKVKWTYLVKHLTMVSEGLRHAYRGDGDGAVGGGERAVERYGTRGGC